MKTMTCKELDGPCDAEIHAESWDDLMTKGMAHIESAHPEDAAKIKAMPMEDMQKWVDAKKPLWDAKPEDAMPMAA